MNKPLVLVVEDDLPIRNLITTTLKTNEYRYLVAGSGESAILEASSHNPDIVLLDLGLPDIDGVQVIKNIRSWSNLPIIVISARSGKASGYAAQAFFYDGRNAVGKFRICKWEIAGGLCRRLCIFE